MKAIAISCSVSKPAVKNSGAYKRTNAGAKNIPNETSTRSISEIVVINREAKSSPPSLCSKDRTNCGIKIAVRAPPTSKLYKIFGIVFATLYVSASNVVPKTATIRIPRTNPVMREIIVPNAMIPEARKSSLDFT